MADDNPFADPVNINPFEDPAVTTAVTNVPQTEDYNPFAEEPKPAAEPEPIKLPPPPSKAEVKAAKQKEKKQEKEKKSKSKPKATNQFSEPAIMEADDPPDYTPAPSSFEDDKLRKKEEEIARREAALHEREQNIERLGSGETPKNFPPFPKFCPSPFKPCFYISVKNEIPPAAQWMMYLLLALLVYLWIMLVVNLILAIGGAITINTPSAQGSMLPMFLTTMGVAIAYLILFVPGSFFCWFLPAYYAFKKDSSLAYMWFFFVMAWQVLSFILGAIGPPNLGACGWYLGGLLFSPAENMVASAGQLAMGAIFIIFGFLWLLGVIPAVILIVMVHKYFRTSGGSINKAVTEGVTGAAKNKAVRSAMKSTVKAGVKTAMSADDN